jgi:hypothetical protein
MGTKEGRAKITRICITKNMRLISNFQIRRRRSVTQGKNLAQRIRNHSPFREVWAITPGKKFKVQMLVGEF